MHRGKKGRDAVDSPAAWSIKQSHRQSGGFWISFADKTQLLAQKLKLKELFNSVLSKSFK